MRVLTEATTLTRLARGDTLRMELREGARQWWFEAPYAVVSDAVMRRVMDRPGIVRLVEAGDSLFGLPRNSQTWLPEGQVP